MAVEIQDVVVEVVAVAAAAAVAVQGKVGQVEDWIGDEQDAEEEWVEPQGLYSIE